jgi:hypothetical protein
MRHTLRILVVVLLAGLLFAVAFFAGHGALAQGSGPVVEWWVVAGGGTSSDGTGGEVVLQDTLGQPVVGPSSGAGGHVALSTGYWTGAVTYYRVYLPLVLRQ